MIRPPVLSIVRLPNYPVWAVPPTYQSDGAAGIDLIAAIGMPEELRTNCASHFGTGIAVAIPAGYVGAIRSRSGLAFNNNVTAFHGTIDADYRGEIIVMLENHGCNDIEITPGKRIAQLLIMPCPQAQIVEVAELPPTRRGSSGFGSTGTKAEAKEAGE